MENDKMKIKYNEFTFIRRIKAGKGRTDFMSRGHILDLLAENDNKWCNVIRALLLGKNEMLISVTYLIEKVNYCQNYPDNPENLLIGKYRQIFEALQLK